MMTSINRMINLHKNKAKDKCLKTKRMKTFIEDKEMKVKDEDDEEESEVEKQTPLACKRKIKYKASVSKT